MNVAAKHLITIAALLSVSFAVAAESRLVTTVILVRHAEKDSEQMAGDPPLSAAGTTRARELARVLADASVTAIYTTPYRRTEGTAAPLAAVLGLKPIVVTSKETYAADVAASIRSAHAGKTVLVVGHSNTAPEVMRQLGIEAPPAIPDSRYDDLFVVMMAEGSPPQLLRIRYGAAAR